MDTVLRLDKITHAYGSHRVVQGLSLQLQRGEIGCLLGPSGCGKTTVMRTIAGFEALIEGEIRIDDEIVSRPGFKLGPEKRKVGMVFQDYALFPHLTIFDNVVFGLRNLSKAERVLRGNEVLELVGLEHESHKYPHEISGGQQQRIALARALAPRPGLLLMDEPFSNLDVTLRERLSMEVRDILKGYGATALFVTHNQHEAFAIADKVGVMHDGRMMQWDTPLNLYHRPIDPFVANFVGEGALIPGFVVAEKRVDTGLGLLDGLLEREFPAGRAVELLVRPEDVIHDDESPVKAEVLGKTFRGASILYRLRLNSGDKIEALVPSHCEHDIGEQIGIRPDLRHLVVFSD